MSKNQIGAAMRGRPDFRVYDGKDEQALFSATRVRYRLIFGMYDG
jgi:hypothetical protein